MQQRIKVLIVSDNRESFENQELLYRLENEADIFANQMKFVKALQPYEVFMANLEANNPDQLMIRDLVESYGLTIGTKRAPGVICAVSALESIYSKYGMQYTTDANGNVVEDWNNTQISNKDIRRAAVADNRANYRDNRSQIRKSGMSLA